MPKKLHEVGDPSSPAVIWTLPLELVKNDNGKDEFIISIPKEMLKHLKLKKGDSLFFGERAKNCYEVRKTTKEELSIFKINMGQENMRRDAIMKKFTP
jgi:bifunctional DNA-binding transcriptional regulator/antitoxin component of YhaV-PrlF toxin-antitoxin module